MLMPTTHTKPNLVCQKISRGTKSQKWLVRKFCNCGDFLGNLCETTLKQGVGISWRDDRTRRLYYW